MAIATTVVLEGKNKNKKELKLTLQVEMVGGTSSVKVCLCRMKGRQHLWLKSACKEDEEDAAFHL